MNDTQAPARVWTLCFYALSAGRVARVSSTSSSQPHAPQPTPRHGHPERRHEGREERIMSIWGELVDAHIWRLENHGRGVEEQTLSGIRVD